MSCSAKYALTFSIAMDNPIFQNEFAIFLAYRLQGLPCTFSLRPCTALFRALHALKPEAPRAPFRDGRAHLDTPCSSSYQTVSHM